MFCVPIRYVSLPERIASIKLASHNVINIAGTPAVSSCNTASRFSELVIGVFNGWYANNAFIARFQSLLDVKRDNSNVAPIRRLWRPFLSKSKILPV